MNIVFRLFFSILLISLSHASHGGDASSAITESGTARLVAEFTAVMPGQPFRMGLLLEHRPGWHSYAKDPGDAGLPTSLAWTLPEGVTAGEIDWPSAEKIREAEFTVNGYRGRVLLPVTIAPPADFPPGASIPVRVHAQWLACKELCLPESADLTLAVAVAGSAVSSSDRPLFQAHDNAKLPGALAAPATLSMLAAALLGGMILNLMPCVFPVLSLKALAIARKSGAERRKTLPQGVCYTLGVLVSFALLAGVLLALQQGGAAVGWGFQMQSPGFVAFLAYLLFLVGLNLSGLFDLPVLLGHAGSELARENSLRGSFFTGVLAAMVATPCTAPFMATAVGFALAQPPLTAFLLLEAVGAGLALPFLLLSAFPQLLRVLPKPGAWMERLRRVLAFPMYASAAWLLWVLWLQTGMKGAAIALGVMSVLMLMTRFGKALFSGASRRSAALAATGVLLAGSLGALERMERPAVNASSAPGEAVYSAQALEALRAQGKPVFIDATAAWCLTCQVNKKLVLDTAAVRRVFRAHDITLMTADWTRRDPAITSLLGSFGYRGVPLYIYYPPDGSPIVLPQVLTQSVVLEAVAP